MRFIPTPVGNTPPRISRKGRRPVHPHACGEHCPECDAIMATRGSSPRLWGTHLVHGKIAIIKRFIPTPVGNTTVTGPRQPVNSVHPHACGEHFCNIIIVR
ncbi:hypothetical protein D1AOALGA4SA_11482 [Olavius algarvensis Delta 1 endosymbiont]|nr:hypothetical protein D1AOALGA4SA_11482 [Olavius algarvensis Delta 1 endosymbiont]